MSPEGQSNWLWRLLESAGGAPIKFFTYVLDILGLISVALSASLHILEPARRPLFLSLFLRKLYKTGVRALYVSGVIAAVVGAFFISRLYGLFPRALIEDQYAQFFVLVVVREIGPLISGIILIAMSATATTAEIGFLRVLGEFEILHGLGISPVFIFLVPVFFAYPLSLALMMVYFDGICLVSTYLFTFWGDPAISFTTFFFSILDASSFNEVAISMVKALLGGMLIGVVSIHFGARATESFEAVSDAISKSTTTQLLLFLFLNVVLSLVGYSQ